MKRTLLLVFSVLAALVPAFGQGANLSGAYGFTTWRINNHPVASQYNFRIDSVGATIPSAFTFPVSVCNNALALPGANNRSLSTLSAGNSITVKISDNGSSTNNETVTLNSVTVSGGNCVLSLANVNSHFSYILSSGTCGGQEALNDIGSKGTVEVTQEFYDANCSASTITGTLKGASGNFIHDISNGREDWYGWNGTAFAKINTLAPGGSQFVVQRPTAVTQISAPSAPTVTVISGSLTSGAYRVKVAYVDVLGGISLASTDSTQTATTTGLSIASPAATTGAVGWLPYITANGGGAGTEILAKAAIDSTICTLTTQESVTPACAIGSTATVTAANPSSTSKPVAESTAFTTFAAVTLSAPPAFPIATSYPIGVFAVGGTINSGSTANEDLAQFQLPANFFTYAGQGFEVCVKGATATQVASSTLTLALTASNNYAQSPVTLGSFAFGTYTQGAAGTQNGCFDVVATSIGASGTFWISSPGIAFNILNSAPTTLTGATAEVSTAVSSTVDTTKEIYFAINYADGTANNITGPIINSLELKPLQ